MISDPYYLAVTAFSLAGCLYAFVKGEFAERAAAGVIITNLTVGFFTLWLTPSVALPFHLTNDAVAAVALLVLTVRYAAPWLGGSMLLYAIQFALHSYYLVLGRPHDYVFAVVNNVNFYGIIWCLIIGASVAWRRRVVARKQADRFPEDAALQAAP